MSSLVLEDVPLQVVNTAGYVRRARRLADLSQRDLAAATGIHQSVIARIETGRDVSVGDFVLLLEAAGLRLAVIDESDVEVEPMPDDSLRDEAGRRQPSHLDVYAQPETPSFKRLVHGNDTWNRRVWHARRIERDLLRRKTGRSAEDEQLTVSEVAARTRERLAAHAMRPRSSPT